MALVLFSEHFKSSSDVLSQKLCVEFSLSDSSDSRMDKRKSMVNAPLVLQYDGPILSTQILC